jgi:hypothetical protein
MSALSDGATFEFDGSGTVTYPMLGNSLVAAQLAVSQEGFSSVGLVSLLVS